MSHVDRAAAAAHTGVQTNANTVELKAGTQLERSERDYFGARFGHDFSRVRVHTDAESLEAARALDARAFTLANHVVLADAGYRTGTAEGRELLAHELAHVVQQASAGAIPRPASWLAWSQRTREGDRHELDAARSARAALREDAVARPQLDSAPMVARQQKPPAKDDDEQQVDTPPVDLWKGTPISRMVISLARGRIAMVMARGALTGKVKTDVKPGLYTIELDKTTPHQWRFVEPKVPEGLRFEIDLDQADPWTLVYPDKIPLEVSAGSSVAYDDKMPWSQLQSIIAVDPEYMYEGSTPPPVTGIDDFETAKYNISYKAMNGNLSNVILVEYRNGVTKDIDIPSITEATPRLWEAKKQAREIQGQYNFEFELQTFGAIWFILTIGASVDVPGPKVETPGPKVETPGPKVETPGPKVETPGPKVEAPGPKVETPGPKVETKTPNPESPSGQPLTPKAPDAPVPPGYKPEPTLKNSGWGPRPEGGDKGAEYAEQVTHSNESLYVHGLKDELGGTGVVELDGLENQILIDAKDAGPKSMYDVSGADKFTQNFKIPKVLDEAMRQGWAMIRSGAKGIEWRVSNEKVANALSKLFADRGVKITVKFVPKAAKPVPP